MFCIFLYEWDFQNSKLKSSLEACFLLRAVTAADTLFERS